MARQIRLTYKGVEYTLEYTRKTIEMMETAGFNLDDVTTKPMTAIPMLFRGAFLAHHRNVEQSLVDEIFGQVQDVKGLLRELNNLYAEPINAMLDDEGKEKNAIWTVS